MTNKRTEEIELAKDEAGANGAIAAYMRSIIEMIGEDPTREGLRRTPERFEQALRYLTSGYQQDAEKILLGYRGAHHEQRPEHADQDDAENREANRGKRDPLASPAMALAIRDHRQGSRHRHGGRRDVGPRRGREPEFSLTEHDRGEVKEKSEEGVEHEFLRILLRATD